MAVKHTQEEKQYKMIEQIIDNCRSDEGHTMDNNRLFKASEKLLAEIDGYTGTKLLEIHLIEMLEIAEGYFGQEFLPTEIATMRNNIKSDFPIFTGTHIGELQNDLQAYKNEIHGHLAAIQTRDTRLDDVEKENKNLRNVLNQIVRFAVNPEISQSGDRIEEILGLFNKNQVIMGKLQTGCNLTAEEIKIVESNITNY